jgi:ferric-dicitrate binding protein FerR (iron transport regulator)
MKESEYLLLLQKKFSGEIQANELPVLEHWLRSSEQNQQLAEGLKRVWDKTEGYGKTFQPDLSRDFLKVQARIRATETAPMRVSSSRALLRIAAAIAILVVSIWSWNHFSGPENMEAIAASDQKSLILPDGSQVWLRKGSSLTYPKSLSGSIRGVKLTGEGFFKVAHDPYHPFKVELAAGGYVQVLGTEFDIRQEEAKTIVLVQSGKVRFAPNAKEEGPILTAGQKAEFDHNAGKITISKPASMNELAWQKGGLEFVGTPLSQVVKDLEQYYGVAILLNNTRMGECPHSAPLTSQSIEKVLESLALTHQMTLEKTGEKKYSLSGGSCR